MQREIEVGGVPFQIKNERLYIGSYDNSPVTYYTRNQVPKLIAFIQAWLDHDPEQELIEKVKQAWMKGDPGQDWKDVIAAVRDHDAKYHKET